MRLTLTFAAGNVTGEGEDRAGPFKVTGLYGADSATLTKFYPRPRVEYEGRWDGQVLFGTWIIVRLGDSGTFEIWPESEETTIGR